MNDVLLINPPLFDTTLYGKLCIEPAHAPCQGLAYLAACLERQGYGVVAEDMYYGSWSDIESLLQNTPSRMIGVSCLTDQRASAFRVLRLAKQIQPQAVVAAGGIHPTLLGKQMLENIPELDIAVMGEAEETIGEIVDKIDQRRSWKQAPGIGFRLHPEEIYLQPRVFTRYLDNLPFPSYKHFRTKRYTKPLWLTGLKALGKRAENLRYVNVLGSRGCTHRCLFCASPRSLGKRWHKRSPDHIVAELEMLIDQLKYEYVAFSDEVFTEDPQWTVEICQRILNHGIEFAWECQARADTISPALVGWMKRAGCLSIAFGIESLSDKILENIHKDITAAAAIKAIEICQHAGIAANALIMVGNPGETDETIAETQKRLTELRPHAVSPDIATIFPGTGLYRLAQKAGLIDDSFWIREDPAPYFTVEHPIERLKAWNEALLACNEDASWFRYLAENPRPVEDHGET